MQFIHHPCRWLNFACELGEAAGELRKDVAEAVTDRRVDGVDLVDLDLGPGGGARGGFRKKSAYN